MDGLSGASGKTLQVQGLNERQPHWLAELTGEGGRRLIRLISGRLIDPQHADDLAQEVYLRLLRMQDDGIIREPRAFALRVAANIAYEWRMLARNRRPHSSDALDVLEADEQPFDQVAHGQEMQLLEEASGTSHSASRSSEISWQAHPKVRFPLVQPWRCRTPHQGLSSARSVSGRGSRFGTIPRLLSL